MNQLEKTPVVVVDAIIEYPNKYIALIQRGVEPFKGQWALPGGHVNIGETVEKAVIREAKEETGIKVKIKKLLGVYSDPKRDPRRHSVAVVFICHPISGKLKANTDAKEVYKVKNWQKLKLAFDHKKILTDYQKQR